MFATNTIRCKQTKFGFEFPGRTFVYKCRSPIQRCRTPVACGGLCTYFVYTLYIYSGKWLSQLTLATLNYSLICHDTKKCLEIKSLYFKREVNHWERMSFQAHIFWGCSNRNVFLTRWCVFLFTIKKVRSKRIEPCRIPWFWNDLSRKFRK